jgi:predicted nucleotidyltransferase
MLRSALDHILGTTAKVRLLRALLPFDTPASGREAERLAVVSHRSATRALDDLVALGVLRRTTTPATHLYQVNREHDLVPLLESLFRGEAARLASLREEIEAALEAADLKGTISSVVLFGSAARGVARPDSDLDLLVLVQDRLRSEAASDFLGAISDRLRSRYGARASVLVLWIPEARRRLEDGDALMQNVIHDSRTLFGTPIPEVLGAW